MLNGCVYYWNNKFVKLVLPRIYNIYIIFAYKIKDLFNVISILSMYLISCVNNEIILRYIGYYVERENLTIW